MQPRDRLIVALDFFDVAKARALIAQLGDSIGVYKVGYQLGLAGGLTLARDLAQEGKAVFVDMKLHDIGHTVMQGAKSVAALGARFLTVHAYPQTMKAAVEAARGTDLKILAVTVLTSYDDADLEASGYRHTVRDLVALRARQARECGVHGLVCSAEEASMLRSLVGPGMLLVTPGIRPAGAAVGDQKRVMTPVAAINAGADYLVVGRPITEAADPQQAAAGIVSEIAQAGNQTASSKRE